MYLEAFKEGDIVFKGNFKHMLLGWSPHPDDDLLRVGLLSKYLGGYAEVEINTLRQRFMFDFTSEGECYLRLVDTLFYNRYLTPASIIRRFLLYLKSKRDLDLFLKVYTENYLDIFRTNAPPQYADWIEDVDIWLEEGGKYICGVMNSGASVSIAVHGRQELYVVETWPLGKIRCSTMLQKRAFREDSSEEGGR